MSKCKRCHAPDELNGIGLCKHCTAFIKSDVRTNKERLEAIYNCFPEGMETLDEGQKAAYLSETEQIFHALDQYHRIGFPVGSYVMPVRKILHFLDGGGGIEKRLLAQRRRRTLAAAAGCAALAVAFAVVLMALGNQPLTGGELGEAVAVSGGAAAEGMPDMTEGAEISGMEGMEDGTAPEAMDGEAGETGTDGSASGALPGEASDEAGEAPDADNAGGEASAAEGEEADGDEGDADSAAEDTGTAAAVPAPRRVSGSGGGSVAIIGGGGAAIRIG